MQPKSKTAPGSAAQKSVASEKTMRHLLAELYVDREYMSDLLKDQNLMLGSKSTKLYDLIQDGLTYLDTRADFWRQQKPMYARKREQKLRRIKPSLTKPLGAAGKDYTKFVVKSLEEIYAAMDNGDAEGSLQQARRVLKTLQSLNEKDLPSKQELIASLYSVIGTAQLELGEADKSLENHLKDYQLVTTNKYLEIRIQDGGGHNLQCPGEKCSRPIPSIRRRLVSKELNTKYTRFDIRTFVDTNHTTKWCPHVECEGVVHLPPKIIANSNQEVDGAVAGNTGINVECANGHLFFWSCHGSPHEPCNCDVWQRWVIECFNMNVSDAQTLKLTGQQGEAAANIQWILQNSKPCPKSKWTKAHDLLIKYDMREHMIPKMVEKVPIALRDGHKWLLDVLAAHKVPLLVFSAGLSNMIVEVLKQKAILHENIRIISNDMIFKNFGCTITKEYYHFCLCRTNCRVFLSH